MKTDAQALTEWVNDEIKFYSCNKAWVLSRVQVGQVVRALKENLDLLFNKDGSTVMESWVRAYEDGSTVMESWVRAYEFFPLDTLREMYARIADGATLTDQEFAKCGGVYELVEILQSKVVKSDQA